MTSALVPWSVATRGAGIVIAVGYLSGYVTGPVVAVVGGLGLITFGRVLLVERGEGALAAVALTVIAGALGVGALRWEALSLGDIRGAQAVLGPTVLVDPAEAAGAAWAGGLAGILALGVWLARPLPVGLAGHLWLGLEAAVGGLALLSVFWGEAAAGLPDLGPWVVGTLAAGAASYGLALVLRRLRELWAWTVVLTAGAVVFAAAGVTSSVL